MITGNQHLNNKLPPVPAHTVEGGNAYFLSVGRMLSTRRQQQGKSLEQMEELTGLCPFQIRALESGDFKKFRAPTYTKGYIKVYSRAVGLDEEKLLETYRQGLGLEKETQESESRTSTDNRIRRPVANTNKRILSKIITPFTSPAVAFCLLGVLVSLVLPVQSLVMSEENPAESAAPARPAQGLEITVQTDSWVEVIDAEGNILLADLKTSGQTEVLQGSPPFQITVDGGQISAKYLGESIHLNGVSGDNTAKLVVGR